MPYCGVAKPRGGAKIGTEKECAKSKQVRLYGLNKVDKKVVDKYKAVPKKSGLTKTQQVLKLKKLEDDGKILVNKIKNARVVANLEGITAAAKKQGQKVIDGLLSKRDALVKRIKAQNEVVKKL